MLLLASDYQESKNVNTLGANALPNTAFKTTKLDVVNGPTVTWVSPATRACAPASDRLVAVASDTGSITSVTFFDGEKKISVVKKGVLGIYGATWRTTGASRGDHRLRAVVVDKKGKQATAERTVRVCGK